MFSAGHRREAVMRRWKPELEHTRFAVFSVEKPHNGKRDSAFEQLRECFANCFS
jgi:hypothetical protein